MSLLHGLRVLDLSRVLAGPLAGQILGDMGAEVLKVESPQGDATRAWGPPYQNGMSAYFQCCNRNKSSLVMDLKQADQQARLKQLMAAADVMIHNFLPKTAQNLGLDKPTLEQRFPRIVAMAITGYRQGTSRENEAGYDAMLQAEAGVMSLTGPAAGDPFKVGLAWVDVLTGTLAANGILAGLYRRAQTERGVVLDISLFQTALYSLINVGSGFHVTGEVPRRYGNAHANIVPYQLFRLADRPLVIAVGSDRQFFDLCLILGQSVDHPTNHDRVLDREKLVPALSRLLAQWQSTELLPRLKAANIPATPVLTVAESFAEARRFDPDAVVAVAHPEVGEITTTQFPVFGFEKNPHRAPPLSGEGGRAMAEKWLAGGGVDRKP